ncbi:hypothetical protein RJT34_02699 [Clitoria ternatea]|uniref:Uncharacterized protein n=1 Tax=Clitoria ternatea TaxID=43366 RepID=A0AAN9Q124_CLITE
MSGSSNDDISNSERRGFVRGGSDGDDDDDDDSEIERRQHRRARNGFRKAGQVVLHQFTKAKKQIRRIRSRKDVRSAGSGHCGAVSYYRQSHSMITD